MNGYSENTVLLLWSTFVTCKVRLPFLYLFPFRTEQDSSFYWIQKAASGHNCQIQTSTVSVTVLTVEEKMAETKVYNFILCSDCLQNVVLQKI